MSRNYDNWERLVAAVIKREEIWELCHQPSRTPSACSQSSSSDFSWSLRSSDAKLEDSQNDAQKPVPKLVPLEGALKIIQVLGKGRFGTSILVQLKRNIQVSDQVFLTKGTNLVIKELVGEVKVTAEESKTLFGNCRHENVAAPRAYYFSSNGNYIFNDYHGRGSLHDMLPVFIRRPVWGSRLKIAIGAARGIAHIHSQYNGKLAHGNIRSSNIFINSQQYGCVSDFGLANIKRMPGEQGGLEYHASRYEFKNASHKGDVYSFGVVLLELLTGRSAMEPQGPQKNLHIVEWARSVDPKDLISHLFDQSVKELIATVDYLLNTRSDIVSTILLRNTRAILCFGLKSMEVEMEQERKTKAEMLEMLQVATRCLATLPQDRPEMFEVVLMLENIRSSSN